MKCQSVPPGQTECLEPPTHRVSFSDKQIALTCETCALRLKQIIGHTVKVEKLP